MTAPSYYNPDKGYELMANIVDRENGPYDETAREDMVHILKLCYIYSANEGKPNELSAGALGQAIVGYLSGGWGIPDFAKDAEAFWAPTPTYDELQPDNGADKGMHNSQTLPGLEGTDDA